jgi:hypothetical protein
MGDTDISYNQDAVSLHIPGQSERTYQICGLIPESRYALSTGKVIVTDHNGTATFNAPAGLTVALQRDRD